MSSLGPAYLIHGDDHGAVAERRLRLRALAEAGGAETTIEALQGSDATPAGVCATLSALRLGVARRVIVVDGVERWKDAEVKEQLAPALAELPPDTTLALFAREDARTKAPPALHRAVKDAGGQVAREATLRTSELPKWVSAQGRRLGLALDPDAGRALVTQVGESRQRLTRELEKLALEADASVDRSGEQRRVSAEQIELRIARSAQLQAYALADALVEGTLPRAILSYVRLRAQGERVSGLLYLMASRLRQALSAASRLERGEPASAIKRSLRMPSRAAERLLADAGTTGSARLQDALGVLADLELHTRGGPIVRSAGAAASALEEDTLALRAIDTIARRDA
jgi:DNA polymerase-3 subunit delta